MKSTKFYILLLTLFLGSYTVIAQHTDGNVFGDVQSNGEHIPFATVFVEGTTIGTTTDETGHYMLIDLAVGKYVLVAKSLGFTSEKIEIEIVAGKTIEVNFVLDQETMRVDEVVITGTKTFKRQTDAAVIVNVLDAKMLNSVEACNISEGLKFQPGLRVETDCQTCNYSQLRMNGLGGGYSQILINGRPIFSPLIGLYGMEQIPANMVERIEIVRGGGSALYGSSAIGGTVNVITRIPNKNSYDVSFVGHSINGEAIDNVLNSSINMLTRKRNAGAVIYINRRHRDAYDHPGITYMPDGSQRIEKDNFSELPELRNNSFGANFFYRPTQNQKLEMNFTSLHEYRFGGELINKIPHLTQQSEERVHNILMGGLDYQLNFNEDNSSFIAYLAGQYTDRDHYTGIYPDAENEQAHLANPPYGYTYNPTIQGGTQLNHRFQNFLLGPNIVTVGAEYIYDDVLDSIPAYHYGTDQVTTNVAGFIQSDWLVFTNTTLLLGLRADKHNLLDRAILSPRASIMYKLKDYTQFRLTWGTGFRAPQAFDTDMHIAFAAGGISRISLAEGLKEERSSSVSGSVNYDLPKEKFILGFTLEGFYTKLNDAFYLQPIGADDLGERFEKRNGPGALVKGTTLELRANYNKQAQLEAGLTLQNSMHAEAIDIIDGLEPKKEFLRTPTEYGYLVITVNPSKRFSAAFSSVYTGSMELAKYSPDPDNYPDEFRTTDPFTEINLKLSYTMSFEVVDSSLEIFGGIKNITNKYQDDFDNYKFRDSNYVYGPATPRTIYLGIRLKSI